LLSTAWASFLTDGIYLTEATKNKYQLLNKVQKPQIKK